MMPVSQPFGTPTLRNRVLSRQERSTRTAVLVEQLAASTDEEERDRVRSEIVVLNRGVAEAVASRYRDRGVPREDLVQIAYEGLIKAVVRFDPALRNDLLTYAVPVIRGEIQRYFRDNGWTVRPTRRIQELQWQINQAVEVLERELGREPTESELLDRLDVPSAEYREALAAFGCFTPASLDQPTVADGPATIGDMVPDELDGTTGVETRLLVVQAVGELPQLDRRIVYLRFFEEKTQVEIGRQVGLSQMQVSRRLSRALRSLRGLLAHGETPFEAIVA